MMRNLLLGGIPFLFLLLLAAKPASAHIENISPNLGMTMCQPDLRISATAARHYAQTGKIPPSAAPLHSRAWYAIALGDTSALERLLKKDKKIIKDKSLMGLSASINNGNPLALLLADGADPNLRIDKWGSTLLDVATSCQHAVSMTYLLNDGANPNLKNKSDTDAMFATLGGISRPYFTLGVLVLLSSGYNATCDSNHNETAYFIYKTLLHTYGEGIKKRNGDKERKRMEYKKLKNIVSALENATELDKRRKSGMRECP